MPVVDGKEGVDGGGAEKGQVSSWPHEGSSHVTIVENWTTGPSSTFQASCGLTGYLFFPFNLRFFMKV